MAEKIRMDTERLEELSAYMRSLTSALRQARQSLGSVAIDRASGADVEVNLPSSRLNTVDSRMRSGKARSCMASISETLGTLAAGTDALARSLAAAAGTFSDAEQLFVQRFGGTDIGSPSLLVCDRLGIDRGAWTPEVARRVSELINNGRLVLDDGFICSLDGSKITIMGPGDLAFIRESEIGFTGERYTERIILPGGGMREAHMENGFLTFGLLAEDIPLLEQNKSTIAYNNKKEAEGMLGGTPLDILTAGTAGKISSSVLHGGIAGEGERWSGEINADLFKTDVEYSIKGGMGVYIPDENGNPQLYFGGGVKVGASACAAEISASGEYELIDQVSIIGEGRVSAMEVTSEFEGKVGVVDGELAAYVHAGMEADLVKLEGKGGVDVAGIKAQVGGAVKVGIGASASAGYSDGKFSLEVSAALGVGVEANIEIDVRGFVDNTTAVVGKAVEGMSSMAADLVGGIVSNIFK